MFIAKKHLSRWTLLRGVGASLALPFLDSMVPAQTPLRHTAATSRTRLACIEMVHGAAGSTDEGGKKHYWSPEKEGVDFDFSYSLEPLAPFREYITIVSGTDAAQAERRPHRGSSPVLRQPLRVPANAARDNRQFGNKVEIFPLIPRGLVSPSPVA